jgi:hypothetical protein
VLGVRLTRPLVGGDGYAARHEYALGPKINQYLFLKMRKKGGAYFCKSSSAGVGSLATSAAFWALVFLA